MGDTRARQQLREMRIELQESAYRSAYIPAAGPGKSVSPTGSLLTAAISPPAAAAASRAAPLAATLGVHYLYMN